MMDLKDMNKGLCSLKLNAITSVDNDPLLSKLTFSILDFNISGNRQIVEKDLAIEASPSLKGKPLLCVYSPNTNLDEESNAHFNDHGEELKLDYFGKEYIGTSSIAIGTALEGGYITTMKNESGEDEEVLACDFYVWNDRNVEVIQLINEMYEQGLPLYSSCEYYYFNYEMIDGIQKIKSPLIFSGHCCLGSGENGSEKVDPAYDCSKMLSFNEKLNEAIHKAINNKQNNESKKEDDRMAENLLFKSLNELSHGDIRSKIMGALAKTMTADEFSNVWVGNYMIYDTYFVYENYTEGKWVNFKVPYSKTETEVVVDLENKALVERDSIWVEVTQVTELQTSLNAKEEELKVANEKITELETSLNEKDETIKSLNSQKEGVVEKFNNATELVTSLNSKVEELSETVETLKPLAEKYNEEQQTKALNSAIDSYKSVFNKAGANEVFEEESTMELIKKTLNSKVEIANDAKFQLNQLIIDNIKGIKVEKEDDSEPMVKSINSVVAGKETKGLVDNFVDPYEEYCGFSR